MDVERFADRLAYCQAWVERGIGVLEDHLHPAAHGHQIAAPHPGHINAVDPNLPLGRLDQTNNSAP